MRQLAVLMLTVLCWGLGGSSSAHAQIESGDFRLFLDAGLVNWEKHEEKQPIGGTAKSDMTTIAVLGVGGLGVGYAVSKHFIPSLYLSLQNAKVHQDGLNTTVRQWELRPALEIALLPSLRFVPYASAGLSLQRLVVKDRASGAETSATAFGVGPALGVGVHGFLTEHASLDLSLVYRAGFFGKTKVSGDAGVGFDAPSKQTIHALLLNLGASFWL